MERRPGGAFAELRCSETVLTTADRTDTVSCLVQGKISAYENGKDMRVCDGELYIFGYQGHRIYYNNLFSSVTCL